METIEKISKAMADLRIIPRILAILWTYIVYLAWEWFTPQPDISTGQGAFLSAIIASACGYTKWYCETGNRNE